MSGTFPPPPGEPLAPEAPAGTNRAVGRSYDRVPPHSLDAEVSVLGSALLSRAAASDAVEALRPEDFYRNAHRVVFEAVRDLTSQGEPVDTVTVTDWLARRDRLDEVGGAAALHDLTVAVPTAANAAYYARIVRDKALLRRLIDAGTAVTRSATRRPTTPARSSTGRSRWSSRSPRPPRSASTSGWVSS
jgi:replicative DNA helicase